MQGGVERIFLGWDRPFLDAAAARWFEHVGERGLATEECVLVLPGRRAARRLEERLASLAPPLWKPPRVVSEGELARVLMREPLRVASEWQRAAAWREALASASQAEREALWSSATASTAGLASLCARTFAELAREGLDCAAAAEAAARVELLGDARRWSVLAGIEARYRAALRAHGVHDPAAIAREAADAELDSSRPVQLFALVDPPRALRKVLERMERVASFVFAPSELQERFDELGALRVERWAEADVEFDDTRWRVVDGPDDQAREALEILSRVDPAPSPEDVAVGVPDEDVLPHLERRLLEAGCQPRWAGGQRLEHTREARLALDAFSWLARPGVEEFARLAANPDFERLCERRGGELGAALDRYVDAHAPRRIDGDWRAPDRHDERAAIETLETALARARELFGDVANGVHSSSAWADALARWCTAAFGAIDLGARDERGWKRARAVEALSELVREIREADSRANSLRIDAASFREMLATRCSTIEVPPPPSDGRPVVELFGWLELVLDDAPHLVVTGVQEGSLPQSSGAGWLTEGARRELGLGHEQRRVARDVWALSAILASRPRTVLITGRRSSERHPHRPSRFVMRCAPELACARVRAMWPEHESEPPAAQGAPTPYAPPIVPRAFGGVLRVTDFATYLRSPYEFYVARVLGLEPAASRVLELDPRRFGVLAHEVLEILGREEWLDCDDAGRLRVALEDHLDRIAAARFGASPRPAVLLQIEKLRSRLAEFADWQAKRRESGWRIHAVEWKAPQFPVGELKVAGRVDRIERHVNTGAWCVSDYKTGDKAKKPKPAHFSRSRGWTDLQLPLYRELTRTLWNEGELELGYVNLSRDEDAEPFARFDCSAEEHADAMEAARGVVSSIVAGEFARVGDKPPYDESVAALCGFGLLAGEEDDGGEEA